MRKKHSSNTWYASDAVGILGSGICFVHCVAAPGLILLGLNTDETPWMKYVFILVAFLSIWFSIRKGTPMPLIFSFWLFFWIFLFSLLYEHQWEWLEYTALLASVAIIICHIWNVRSCRACNKDQN